MLNIAFERSPSVPPAGPLALESLLLGELAHRTVNDFSAASAALHLARRNAQPDECAGLLAGLALRLDALGTIQRMLQAPDHGRAMDLTGRLEQLCEAMAVARFAERGIELHLQVDDIVIESGRGWRILMIVAELLVNASRHAFGTGGGRVHVRLHARGGDIIVGVRDDGCGRPARSTGAWGYGSSVVHLLTQAIEGDASMVSSPAGTSIEIVVPRAASKGTCADFARSSIVAPAPEGLATC
jgi:two-component sensor histidine kinase